MNIYTYEYLGKNGRLGNQLWQIASTIGMSRNDKYPSVVSFDFNWDYKKFFSIPDEYFILRPVSTTDNSYKVIDGKTQYFQECQYWWFIKDEILNYFNPSRNTIKRLNTNYPEFFEIEHKTSIHVRRGDYLNYPRHFPLPTNKYYNDAMDIVKESNPDTQFIVFSDDINWCKKNFSSGFKFIEGIARPVEIHRRRGEPQDQYDLFLQSYCDRHIIANSTSSWWGGVMGRDKDIIYPNKWFGPVLSGIDWKRMIPQDQNWIEVKC